VKEKAEQVWKQQEVLEAMAAGEATGKVILMLSAYWCPLAESSRGCRRPWRCTREASHSKWLYMFELSDIFPT
jgi:hypothetical protein